ncbi:MAG TPA: hypothetical protein VFH11_12935 [Gemmatimonadota bacterium]|nr:hypothetical protein [Gemmatimonadota bacterium]
MSGTLSIVALVLSAALLAGMIVVLVLLRKGEGPRYGASRAYDANRRKALRILTGEEVESVPGDQWFDQKRRRPVPGDAVDGPFREAVSEALHAIVPAGSDLSFDDRGRAWLAAERAWVLAAVSTAELREADLDALSNEAALVVGLVLFNPEPPGGDAKRVALPIQVLFPALRKAGRGDLVGRFEELRDLGTNDGGTSGG